VAHLYGACSDAARRDMLALNTPLNQSLHNSRHAVHAIFSFALANLCALLRYRHSVTFGNTEWCHATASLSDRRGVSPLVDSISATRCTPSR